MEQAQLPLDLHRAGIVVADEKVRNVMKLLPIRRDQVIEILLLLAGHGQDVPDGLLGQVVPQIGHVVDPTEHDDP